MEKPYSKKNESAEKSLTPQIQNLLDFLDGRISVQDLKTITRYIIGNKISPGIVSSDRIPKNEWEIAISKLKKVHRENDTEIKKQVEKIFERLRKNPPNKFRDLREINFNPDN